MKAVRVHKFGPPEALSYDDVEVPTPGPGEALVRVHAVGINRMDVELRAGIYGKESLLDFYFGQNIQFPIHPESSLPASWKPSARALQRSQ